MPEDYETICPICENEIGPNDKVTSDDQLVDVTAFGAGARQTIPSGIPTLYHRTCYDKL